jgi:hypothetical protein
MLSLKYIKAFLGFLTSHCTFCGYYCTTAAALPFFDDAAGDATGAALTGAAATCVFAIV